jgi:hypothetical protein
MLSLIKRMYGRTEIWRKIFLQKMEEGLFTKLLKTYKRPTTENQN